MSGITDHYDLGFEAKRLFSSGQGALEFDRTRELITRHLPPPPAVILDVGGGPGAYSCWLAALGYEAHVIDPVPRHVDEAREASRRQPDHPVASAAVGDARALSNADNSAGAVLLLGPLYHLQDRGERLAALREARRVLRPGGVLFAAAISRYASLLDGLCRGYISDPQFVAIVQQDLQTGCHENATNNPSYFTTAFFHLPEQLREEVREAGLHLTELYAIEGPAWLAPDLDARWADAGRRRALLDLIRRVERASELLAASAHMLAVAVKS